jgi:hypothetical protein
MISIGVTALVCEVFGVRANGRCEVGNGQDVVTGLASDAAAVICLRFQAVSVWDGVEAVRRTGKVVGAPSCICRR